MNADGILKALTPATNRILVALPLALCGGLKHKAQQITVVTSLSFMLRRHCWKNDESKLTVEISFWGQKASKMLVSSLELGKIQYTHIFVFVLVKLNVQN